MDHIVIAGPEISNWPEGNSVILARRFADVMQLHCSHHHFGETRAEVRERCLTWYPWTHQGYSDVLTCQNILDQASATVSQVNCLNVFCRPFDPKPMLTSGFANRNSIVVASSVSLP